MRIRDREQRVDTDGGIDGTAAGPEQVDTGLLATVCGVATSEFTARVGGQPVLSLIVILMLYY